MYEIHVYWRASTLRRTDIQTDIHVGQQKTAPFTFCISFVKTLSVVTILEHIYSNKFPITRVLHILYISETGTGTSLSFKKTAGLRTVHELTTI